MGPLMIERMEARLLRLGCAARDPETRPLAEVPGHVGMHD